MSYSFLILTALSLAVDAAPVTGNDIANLIARTLESGAVPKNGAAAAMAQSDMVTQDATPGTTAAPATSGTGVDPAASTTAAAEAAQAMNQGLSMGNIVGMSVAFGVFGLLVVSIFIMWALKAKQERVEARERELEMEKSSSKPVFPRGSRHRRVGSTTGSDMKRKSEELSDGEEDAKVIEFDFDLKKPGATMWPNGRKDQPRNSRILRV